GLDELGFRRVEREPNLRLGGCARSGGDLRLRAAGPDTGCNGGACRTGRARALQKVAARNFQFSHEVLPTAKFGEFSRFAALSSRKISFFRILLGVVFASNSHTNEREANALAGGDKLLSWLARSRQQRKSLRAFPRARISRSAALPSRATSSSPP